MPPRAVLVTGATSGIGLQTVLEAARRGFRAIGSARDEAKAAQLRRSAAMAGVHVDTVVMDLTDPDAGRDIVEDLGLWGLVNNAGYVNAGAVEDVSIPSARRQFEVMVFAAVRLARLALPGMRARGEGRIVNISSLASRTTTPMTGWYQAAGRALEAVSDALRAEVEDHGIDVVLVAPGAHRTSIWSRAAGDLEVRRRATAHPEAYERALRVLHDLESGAADAAGVARVVGDALVAGHPEARYRVGREPAALQGGRSLTPAGVKDRLLRTVLGL